MHTNSVNKFTSTWTYMHLLADMSLQGIPLFLADIFFGGGGESLSL